MKIISGKYKGRNIHSPQSLNIRPTGAKVKEAIMGKLQFSLIDSSFLDLFAGSGAMGIEALSRGADKVVFNDKSTKAANLIEKNLKLIGEDSTVLNYDYNQAISYMADKELNFVYVDPPYEMDCLDDILNMCYEYKALAVGGMVIYEYNSKMPLNYENNHYIIVDNKQYASTNVAYLKRID